MAPVMLIPAPLVIGSNFIGLCELPEAEFCFWVHWIGAVTLASMLVTLGLGQGLPPSQQFYFREGFLLLEASLSLANLRVFLHAERVKARRVGR